jgi:hypothetical protein
MMPVENGRMGAILSKAVRSARGPKRLWWLAAMGSVVSIPVVAIWWFTAPLEESSGEALPTAATTSATAPEPLATARPAWPESRLEGHEAKTRLLEIVTDARCRIDRLQGYTATFKKQERIAGKLLPEQTMAMKVRQKPFAIYFKFVTPHPGKEVVYAEGHRHNKVIAHNGDWTRRLVPRLEVEPTSTVAMADNRHPITDAGLSNFARKLVDFRKLDLEDSDAVTILDRISGPDGRPWLRSVHLHTQSGPARPFARVEILYDPDTHFPLRISSYDFPQPGEEGDLRLAERYSYDDLALDVPLSALDFDPANPSYEFMRY